MKLTITREDIKHQARQLGFQKVGIAAADAVGMLPERERLQSWLSRGYQADMQWMQAPQRQDLLQVLPEVRTVIALGLNYYTPYVHQDDARVAKISRYAWGRDYHKVLHKRLKALSRWLIAQGEGILARYYADTGPVQDKAWAQQAGLGWVGKNGNLISRDYGSWLFLGEILTNLDLEPDQPHAQHCGTCTRCLDACPTGAIAAPFVVDANRCIAYHTIENRAETLPAEIIPQLQGWVAGCDICQDVCPWNQRFAQVTDVVEFYPYPWNLAPLVSELAELADAEWDRRFRASALRRIKPAQLRRNARAVAARLKNNSSNQVC